MASALGQFTSIIAETFKTWQERQSYLNADPCLKRKYDELVLSERIAEMEKAAQSRTFSMPHGRNSSIITPRNNTNIDEAAIATSEGGNSDNNNVASSNNNMALSRASDGEIDTIPPSNNAAP
jgi:hypothetical protein